jgi:hypothetical protein
MQPTEEFAEIIHSRLLKRDDPTASAELIGAYLELLFNRLERNPQFSQLSDKTLVSDAVTDTLLDYAENPERFDPKKSSLITYLTMAAKGDLLNLINKEQRRLQREKELVAQFKANRNTLQEDSTQDALQENHTYQKLMEQVLSEFPDALDRQLLPLILDRERKTAAYVEILGIQHKSQMEQTRIVKQHKDRINKRLQRLGVKINERTTQQRHDETSG